MTNEERNEKISLLESQILNHKNYLRSKDYMTIREMQGGEKMPADIKEKCAFSRSEINRLEKEIEELENMEIVEEPAEDQAPE